MDTEPVKEEANAREEKQGGQESAAQKAPPVRASPVVHVNADPGKKTPGKPGKTAKTPLTTLRKKQQMAVLAVIMILIGALLYGYVIPRTALQVETLYHQSFSGNSIGVRLKNTGTRDVTNLSVDMEIFDEDGKSVHHPAPLNGIDIPAHKSYKFSTNFRGSQIEKYRIVMNFLFESGGKDYNETVRHTTDGEYMNENWKERLP